MLTFLSKEIYFHGDDGEGGKEKEEDEDPVVEPLVVSVPELVRLNNKQIINLLDLLSNIFLHNKKNSKDGDGEVGSEEHVEPEVEEIVANHGEILVMVADHQAVEDTEVLKSILIKTPYSSNLVYGKHLPRPLLFAKVLFTGDPGLINQHQ